MTATFLQSELTSLIADSKKRSSDVRSAAEKSLTDLRSTPVTSELQLAADLSRKLDFIEPFVLACRARNAKLANSATACLQRLVASKAVPKQRLQDVLTALRDVANMGYEVQLKILQTLPALSQLYANEVHGQLLVELLELCASLRSSRTDLVSSSAGATLEQLIVSVFEEASKASRRVSTNGKEDLGEAEDGNTQSTSADDASRIFEDFCSMLNQSEPTFFKSKVLSTIFILDSLEHLIRDHSTYIRSRSQLLEVCRSQLIPSLQSLVVGKDDFYLYLRVCNMYWMLLLRLSALTQDVTIGLSSLLVFAERDKGPMWKRALSLELFERICSNIGILLRIEDTSEHSTPPIIADLMALLVRIASEDPTLIGLGRQSTMPAQSGQDAGDDDMASIDAQGVGGGLASVNSADTNATGISVHFSTMENQLMDDGDSVNLPSIPKTYLHTLVLGCVSSFCEGLSKFIMPLSVTRRQLEEVPTGEDDDTEDGGTDEAPNLKAQRRAGQSQKYQRLANPLKIKNLTQQPQIQACSNMIEVCWPAILATCSTFLNAALDSHFYHVLIRSMQKLAQVSGTLEMSTPRDALLTSLAKGSVPAYATTILAAAQKRQVKDEEETQAMSPVAIRSPTQEAPSQLIDFKSHGLNVRHLLCLRALLNLGIALGPTLSEDSWFILIETLQQDEALMSLATANRSTSTPKLGSSEFDQRGPRSSLTSEMAAVNTAAKRMFDSTRSYADEKFAAVVNALFRLMGDTHENVLTDKSPAPVESPRTLSSPTFARTKHRPSRSVSGLWTKTMGLDLEVSFALKKVRDLAGSNIHRFTAIQSKNVSWDLVVKRLLATHWENAIPFELRLQAARIVDVIAFESVKLLKSDTHSQEEIDAVQDVSLESLLSQMRRNSVDTLSPDRGATFLSEIRRSVFETLEDILGQSGETLQTGWRIVFRILQYSFDSPNSSMDEQGADPSEVTDEYASYTTVAFRCIQLISNDFLQNLDPPSVIQLVSLLHRFGAQTQDLNMALTTTSLLRSSISLSQSHVDVIDFSHVGDVPFTSERNDASPVHTTTKTWLYSLQQLVAQCKDPRQEVRDAGVRVLLQVLDSVSDKIAVDSWYPILSAAPLSVLEFYGEVKSTAGIQLSITSLVEHTVDLLHHNMQRIAPATNFSKMWSTILRVFDTLLADAPPASCSLIFNSLSRLLTAVRETTNETATSVKGALQLWIDQPPPIYKSPEVTEANQAALEAYMRVFIEASSTNLAVIHAAVSSDPKVYSHVKTAIRTTFLDATHPQYTSDVKKMSPEQQSACEVLSILKNMSSERLPDYAEFLIGLISSTLPTEEISQSKGISRHVQQPKLVAACSQLMHSFREMVEEQQQNHNMITELHLPAVLQMMCNAINTKYTNVPTNPDAPLWRDATTNAVIIVKVARQTAPLPPELLSDLCTGVISSLTSILRAGGLSSHSQGTSLAQLTEDQTFDVASFQAFHTAALTLLANPSTDTLLRRRYILSIFQASLLAEPWYFDFPSDLLSNPLADLSTIRAGSVHDPTFTSRPLVAYAALDALFAFVDPRTTNDTFHPTMAREAVPYLILRIAHTLKTFMADQPLRGLTPLPRPYQTEIKYILETFLNLKCDDVAVAEALHKDGDGTIVLKDGKSLLRVLYAMILRFKKCWERGVMRLPRGEGAWQDEEEGRAIEEAVEVWCERIGEGWGVGS